MRFTGAQSRKAGCVVDGEMTLTSLELSTRLDRRDDTDIGRTNEWQVVGMVRASFLPYIGMIIAITFLQ